MWLLLTANAAGSDFFKRCARDAPNVNECLNEAIQSAIRSLRNGYDALGLSKLDPLNFEQVTLKSPDEKTLDLLNFDVHGLASVVCENSSYTSSGNAFRLSFDLRVPQFAAEGSYKMERFFLGTPHANEGVFTFNLTGYRANFVLDGNIERKEDGKNYAKISGKSSSFNGGTNFRVHFNNLSKGRNRLWNREPEQLLQANKAAIDKVHPVLAANYANLIFQKVPLDQIFPATLVEENGVHNKLYVKFGPYGQTNTSFFEMPRKLEDPKYASNKFEKVAENPQDRSTSVHCPGGDSRLCLVMNSCGSTVGVMVSITVKEAEDSNIPSSVEFSKMSEVFPQELLGVPVYSCIMYFSPKGCELIELPDSAYISFQLSDPTEFRVIVTLLDKRSKICKVTENTPTAPEGLFIWRKNGELSIPLESSGLEELGFCKQNCYPAMGFHHTKNICSNKPDCEGLTPFTILSSPKTQRVTGFVFFTFGSEINLGRWIEPYGSLGLKLSIPRAQQCLYDYSDRYFLNNMHFYLVQNPWETLPC